jgi:general transcription factor 3C polypeptide 3 (transcription factor C subunit 4)
MTSVLHQARHALLSILKRVPHDLIVLNELRPILVETGDYALCARLFNGAFAHYHQAFPTGVAPPADESSAPLPGGGFGSMELLVLADLYNTLESYDDAIRVIRGGTRWLQGRGDQRIWDACEDDREFDAEGTIGRDGEPSPGHYPLDVNARHRLAVARIKMGDTEEGKVRFSPSN